PNGAGGVGDHASAMTLFGAIMMALYRREKTGHGSFVSTSLAANGVWSMGMHVQGMIAGYDPTRLLKEKGYSPFTISYQTRDEGYLMLVGANPNREWPLLCRALNGLEWLTDPRFVDMKSIMQHRAEVRALFAEAFQQMTTSEAMQALDDVDATYSVVEPLRDVVTDAQLLENDVIRPTGDSDPDYQFTVNSPIEMAGEDKVAVRRAPDIGAHSEEILAELGLDAAAITELVAANVVRTRQTPE
ncbi:MAG: CoA transferase, partial [Pseudomonadales bacterium]